MNVLSNAINSISAYIKDNKTKTIVYLSSFLIGLVLGVVLGYIRKDYYDNFATNNYLDLILNQNATIVIFIKSNILFYLFVFVLSFILLILPPKLSNVLFPIYIILLTAKTISVGVIVMFGGGIWGIFTFLIYYLIPSILLFGFLYITKMIFYQNFCQNGFLLKHIRIEMFIVYILSYLIFFILLILYCVAVALIFKIIF